jgi:hypothetical protein
VGDGQDTDIDHGPAQRGLDHAVSHANDEQKEKGERIASRIQDSDDYHQHLCTDIQTVPILEICYWSGTWTTN